MAYNNQNQNNQQNQQNQQSGSQNNNRQTMVPEARGALDNMKYEIASELGIQLNQGYNGDLPSRQAGSIGGYMVNLMQPEERHVRCLQLPPVTFTRSGLRNQKDASVTYHIQAGVVL